MGGDVLRGRVRVEDDLRTRELPQLKTAQVRQTRAVDTGTITAQNDTNGLVTGQRAYGTFAAENGTRSVTGHAELSQQKTGCKEQGTTCSNENGTRSGTGCMATFTAENGTTAFTIRDFCIKPVTGYRGICMAENREA